MGIQNLFPNYMWNVEQLEREVESYGLSEGDPAFHGVVVREAVYFITRRGTQRTPSVSSDSCLRPRSMVPAVGFGLISSALLGWCWFRWAETTRLPDLVNHRHAGILKVQNNKKRIHCQRIFLKMYYS